MEQKGSGPVLVECRDGTDLFVGRETEVLSREELVCQIRDMREGQILRIMLEVEEDAGE